MNYTQIIELIISLGQTVVSDLKLKNAAPEVIADIQAALDAWLKVRGSDVTFQQLESLRVKPAQPAIPQDANPGGQPGGGHH